MYTHIHPPRPYHPHRPPYMFPRGFCLLFSPWFSAITRFRRSTSAVAAIAVQCAKLGRDSAAVRELLQRELLQRELLQLAVYTNQQAASSHIGLQSSAAARFQRSSFASGCTCLKTVFGSGREWSSLSLSSQCWTSTRMPKMCCLKHQPFLLRSMFSMSR